MNLADIKIDNLLPTIKINTNDTCKLLPTPSSQLPLAPLLLNGSIGLILFVSFLILTKIAWMRLESADSYLNQGLITFLYGYRDPQRWYCIPRFEFLRYKDRHHKHNMLYPYIYAPPKLPLANPIELFAMDATKSLEVTNSNSFTSKILPNASNNNQIKTTNNNNNSSNPNHNSTNGIKELKLYKTPDSIGFTESTSSRTLFNNNSSRSSIDDSIGRNLLTSSPSTSSQRNRLRNLDSTFFYPSVLTAEQLHASYISRRLNSFFSIFYKVTDADIIYAKGVDAYEYLLFQRHLILIMLITNLFCLGIILPIHWYSNSEGTESSILYTTIFQRSTIKSVGPNSSLYWAHIFSSICIVIITVYILKSYKDSITISKSATQLARRTLLIGNIPMNQRNRIELIEIFKEFFPRTSVEAIQFIYTTDLLERYQLQLESILVAKEYCIEYKKRYNREIVVKKTDVNLNQYCLGYCRLCSFLYVCSFNWPFETNENGTIFYEKEEQHYRHKINLACEEMVRQPSDYAFITFKSYNQAKRVMERLARLKAEILNDSTQLKNMHPKNDPHVRSVRSPVDSKSKSKQSIVTTATGGGKQLAKNDSINKKVSPNKDDNIAVGMENNKLSNLERDKSSSRKYLHNGPLRWSVRYAPHPDNVEFYDILHLTTTSRFSIILYHLLMIIIFIFFTTPNVVLSILERLYVLRPDKAKEFTGYSELIINYVSILIQIITTELLPTLITLISKQIPYENSASKNHSIMWKVYAFLILMVIIMPSIGMSSAQALISSDINPKCLFPTDNGAYYINYVLSSIFLSTILELIKPTDILFYSFIFLTGRSKAEFEGARHYITNEFSVSMQHTSVLLIFAVVMTYTISCPLIAPAGLVYLIVKHSVDRYHLYYTYFTKKVDESLQHTIIIFVKLSLLLMLLQTTLAISINTGVGFFTFVSQISFWISLGLFVFGCFFEMTSREMTTSKRNKYQRDLCACFYTPRVIGDLLRNNAMPETCISRQV